MRILPTISKIKGNQTLKFGSLTKYNMRNIFLDKSYKKSGRKTIPRHFSKKSKVSISGLVVQSFMQFVFIAC